MRLLDARNTSGIAVLTYGACPGTDLFAVADEIGEAMGEDAEVVWMCWGSAFEVRMPAFDVPELVVTIQGAAAVD